MFPVFIDIGTVKGQNISIKHTSVIVFICCIPEHFFIQKAVVGTEQFLMKDLLTLSTQLMSQGNKIEPIHSLLQDGRIDQSATGFRGVARKHLRGFEISGVVFY